MLFEVGETVVYPHHGAATITEVKKRIIKGEEKLYLKLNVTQGALVSIDDSGAVRAMVGGYDYSTSQFDRASEARRQPGKRTGGNASRRARPFDPIRDAGDLRCPKPE